MKLYYAPLACSLADHIALCEAGLDVELVKVDVFTHSLEDGSDFKTVNPKGYVPALVLDDGQLLTENVAILSWIAEQAPSLTPRTLLERTRLIEWLSFISSEIHKPFIRLFLPADRAEADRARELLNGRLAYTAGRMSHDYLNGQTFGVADAYLYVMLLWAEKSAFALQDPLPIYMTRVAQRPAVRRALQREGLS